MFDYNRALDLGINVTGYGLWIFFIILYLVRCKDPSLIKKKKIVNNMINAYSWVILFIKK